MSKHGSRYQIPSVIIPQLIDLLSVFVSCLLSVFLVVESDLRLVYLNHLPLCIVSYFFAGYMSKIYVSWRGIHKAKLLLYIAFTWLLATVFFSYSIIIFKTLDSLSRLWLVVWAGSGFLISSLVRLALYSLASRFRRQGEDQKKVLLIGSEESCRRVKDKLINKEFFGFVFSESFILTSNTINDCLKAEERLLIEIKDQLWERLSEDDLDEVWIALPISEGVIVRQLHECMNRSTVNIRYIPDLSDFRLFNHRMTEIGPLFVVDLSKTPFEGGARLIKLVQDYVLGLMLFLISSPVMFLIALAIKVTSKGPVLFKQYRQGLDGKLFKIYKFRTMQYVPENVFQQAVHGDPRITKLGAFLRKTSLDELPQFFNVLQGRMSVVGPRPHVPEQNSYYTTVIDDYMQRHRVKPGITGWAQINGLRGITEKDDDMRKRVEYDFYYINNWSLLLDLRIVVMTVVHGFINRQP